MVKIELETSTLAILIAGLYCVTHNVDNLAIPESIYLNVAEKLTEYAPHWDYNKLSFEDWVKHCLLIYPKIMFTDDELKELKESSVYYEIPNGNVLLIISMDFSDVL